MFLQVRMPVLNSRTFTGAEQETSDKPSTGSQPDRPLPDQESKGNSLQQRIGR